MKALYGLESARVVSFRLYMAEQLSKMGSQSTIADPDVVWLRAAAKGDGE